MQTLEIQGIANPFSIEQGKENWEKIAVHSGTSIEKITIQQKARRKVWKEKFDLFQERKADLKQQLLQIEETIQNYRSQLDEEKKSSNNTETMKRYRIIMEKIKFQKNILLLPRRDSF